MAVGESNEGEKDGLGCTVYYRACRNNGDLDPRMVRFRAVPVRSWRRERGLRSVPGPLQGDTRGTPAPELAEMTPSARGRLQKRAEALIVQLGMEISNGQQDGPCPPTPLFIDMMPGILGMSQQPACVSLCFFCASGIPKLPPRPDHGPGPDVGISPDAA